MIQLLFKHPLGKIIELPSKYIDIIIEKLKSDDSDVKDAAAEALINTKELDAKTILAILNPIYCNCNDQNALRSLAHLTGGGKEDVEILLKWLGEPEKNKPQKLDHDLAKKTLKIFSEVWEASKAYKKLNEDLAQQIATVISMKDVRWTPEDLDILRKHKDHLQDFPQKEAVGKLISAIEAKEAFKKWAKEKAAWTSGGIAIHLSLWIILIFLYPKSPKIQAIFFWNPWGRKLLGLGYVHVALLFFDFLQSKLFQPFKDSFLAEARLDEFDEDSYFKNSEVEYSLEGKTKREAIISAISGIRGQVVLEGESGLGKSLYLRYIIKHSKRICVYIYASRCDNGVIEAIQAKLHGELRDAEFLKRLIYSGAIDICIDGINEVNPNTRARIAQFAESNVRANIIMATQSIKWQPATAKLYRIQPLKKEQIIEFLLSRILSDNAVVKGQTYQSACQTYLDSVSGSNQPKELSDATLNMLSNPMDLTLVSHMIGYGKEPNLFRLYEQQYQIMIEDYSDSFQHEFPLPEFSECVYEMRKTDKFRIPNDFEDELKYLEAHKMVFCRLSDKDSTKACYFRHDRIMMFFLAESFMAHQDRLGLHFSDPRFRGVYFMLATLMPDDAAMALREELIQYAAKTKDHTVSDTFVQLMRARKQGNP